ncbi:ATP-binding protein [Noviherbaspirillum malthae]|jgi:two-component system OmpR family sensor kinase|uniref:ATP-binding protein n=1 Tax=Noviherbaspirillum malthae TaxID=1260987 RepID=UPI00189019B6|nr:ATP-binding protein [Noviherbaspirillum malthae]
MGRLFWKFFLWIWIAQLFAVLAIGSSIWLKDRNQAMLSRHVELGPPASFVLDAAESLLHTSGSEGLRRLLLQNPKESLFALDSADRDILGREVDSATLQQVREMQEQNRYPRAIRTIEAADGTRWLVYAGKRRPPHKDGMHGPAGASEPQAGRHGGPRSDLPRFPFLPMFFAAIASLVSAGILAWHFSRPIHHLRSAFDAVASGQLSTRVGFTDSRWRDELHDLGHDFNRMAARLEELVEGQRRLLHDVSHELRSPLARLQVAVGLARQRPERTESSLERIERESMRMDALIGELLTLSRLEAGMAGAMEDTLNIGELVSSITDDAHFEAQSQGKHVVLIDRSHAMVLGRSELLHSAIENVVRNAIRHTAAGTAIEIHVDDDPLRHEVRIAVRDHGGGLPEAELTAIFRPFVKGSSSAGRSGNHGLGLAIAQRVVHAHGGSISAVNAQGGGLAVEIVLPTMDKR